MPTDKTLNKDNTNNPESNSKARKGYKSDNEPFDILAAQQKKRDENRDLINRGFRVATPDTGLDVINTNTNYDEKLYQHFLGRKYDYLPNWDTNKMYLASAKEQSTLEAIGTMLDPVSGTKKIANRIIRDVAKLPELVNLWTGDYNFENSLMKWTERNDKALRDNGSTALTNTPDKLIGDFKGFVNLLDEVKTSAGSVAVETMLVGGVMGKIATSLTEGLADGAKLATLIQKGATFATAFDLTATESVDQAIESYNKILITKMQEINPSTGLFYTKDEVKDLANKGSKIAFWTNQVIGTALNMVGLEEIIMPELVGKRLAQKALIAQSEKMITEQGLKKGVKSSINLADNLSKDAIETAKKVARNKYGIKRSLITGLSEYVEEDLNDFSTDVGVSYGLTGKLNIGHNLKQSILSRQGLVSGVSGFIGGAGNHVIMGYALPNIGVAFQDEQQVVDSKRRPVYVFKNVENQKEYLNVDNDIKEKVDKELDKKQERVLKTVKRPIKPKKDATVEEQEKYKTNIKEYRQIKKRNIITNNNKRLQQTYIDSFNKKADLISEAYGAMNVHLDLIEKELVKKAKNDPTFSPAKLQEHRQQVFNALQYFHFMNNSEQNLINTFNMIADMKPEDAKKAGLIDDVNDKSYIKNSKEAIEDLKALKAVKKEIYDTHNTEHNIKDNLLPNRLFTRYISKFASAKLVEKTKKNLMIKLKKSGMNLQTLEHLMATYIKYGGTTITLKNKGKKEMSTLEYVKSQISKDFILEQLKDSEPSKIYTSLLEKYIKDEVKKQYEQYEEGGKTAKERNKNLNKIENSKEVTDAINKNIELINDLITLKNEEILANIFDKSYSDLNKEENINKLKDELDNYLRDILIKALEKQKTENDLKEQREQTKKAEEKNKKQEKEEEYQKVQTDNVINKEVKKQKEKEDSKNENPKSQIISEFTKAISILHDLITNTNVNEEQKNILLNQYKDMSILLSEMESLDIETNEFNTAKRNFYDKKRNLETTMVKFQNANNENEKTEPINKVDSKIVDDSKEESKINKILSKNPSDNIDKETINEFESIVNMFANSVDKKDAVNEDNAIKYTMSKEEQVTTRIQFEAVLDKIYKQWLDKYTQNDKNTKYSAEHFLEFYKFLTHLSDSIPLIVLKDLYDNSLPAFMSNLGIDRKEHIDVVSLIYTADEKGNVPVINENDLEQSQTDNISYDNGETKSANKIITQEVKDGEYKGNKLTNPSMSVAYNERSSEREDINKIIHYIEIENVLEGRITDLLNKGDKLILEIEDNDSIVMDRPDFISKSDKDTNAKITWGELKVLLKPEDIHKFIPITIKTTFGEKVGYLHNEWFIKKKGLHVAEDININDEIERLNSIRSEIADNINSIAQEQLSNLQKEEIDRINEETSSIKIGDKVRLNTKKGGKGVIVRETDTKYLVKKDDGTQVNVNKSSVNRIKQEKQQFETFKPTSKSKKKTVQVTHIGPGVLNRDKDKTPRRLNESIPNFKSKGITITVFRNGKLTIGKKVTFKGVVTNMKSLEKTKPEGAVLLVFPASNEKFIADFAKLPRLSDETNKYDLGKTIVEVLRDFMTNEDSIVKNISQFKDILSNLIYTKKFKFQDLDNGDKTNYRYFVNVTKNGDIEFAHIDPKFNSSWNIFRISLGNSDIKSGTITVEKRDPTTGAVLGPYTVNPESEQSIYEILGNVISEKYLHINLDKLGDTSPFSIPLLQNGVLQNIKFDNYQSFIADFLMTDVLEKTVNDKDGNKLSKFTIQPTIEFGNIKEKNNKPSKPEKKEKISKSNTNSSSKAKELLKKAGMFEVEEDDEFDEEYDDAISYTDDELEELENETIVTETGLNYVLESALTEELMFNIEQALENKSLNPDDTIESYFVEQKEMYTAQKDLMDLILNDFTKEEWDNNRKIDKTIKENYGGYRLLNYNEVQNRSKTLEGLLNNYKSFETQITSKLNEKLNSFEEEIVEDEESEYEVKPKWDKLLNDYNPMEKASIKLRTVMESIPRARFKLDEEGKRKTRNGKPILIYSKNVLGGKEREDYRLILQSAHAILVDYSSVSSNEKFDVFIKQLKDSNNASLYLFANKIENADDNTKASFINIMSVQDTNSVMILFKSERKDVVNNETGEPKKEMVNDVIPIYNSEKSQISKIIDKFYFDARTDIENTGVLQKKDNKIVLNKKLLNDYKEKILLKTATINDFYNFLNNIGIKFTLSEFDNTVKNTSTIQRLFKAKYGITSPEHFILINGIMDRMIDSILTLNDDTDLTLMSLFTNMNKDYIRGFAKMKLSTAKRFGTSTFKNGEGNMVSSVSKNHMLARTLKQLQAEDSKELAQLSDKTATLTGQMNSGAYRSFWVTMLNGIDKNTMKVGIIDSLKKWSTYSNAKMRHKMNKNELITHMVFSFMNGSKKTWHLMPLTYSDKKTPVYVEVPRYNLNFENFFEASIQKLHPNKMMKDGTLNLKYDVEYQQNLWNYIILPEIKKINQHAEAIFNKKVVKDDISSNEYYGGYLFYFLPELNNNSAIRDNIGRIIINNNTKNILMEYANKAFNDNIKRNYEIFKKMFIKTVKRKGEEVQVLDLVSSSFIKKYYDFSEKDTEQKLSPEEIILLLATDFTVNYRLGMAEYTKILGSSFSSTYKFGSKDIFNDDYILTIDDVEKAEQTENQSSENVVTQYEITNKNKKSFIELIDNHKGHLIDKVKTAINQYTKRMAKDIAPRMDGLWTDKEGRDFSKFRQLYITEPRTNFYNEMYQKLGIEGYDGVEGADAQAYSTLYEYVITAHAFSNIDDDTYTKIINIIENKMNENKKIINILEEQGKSHEEILKALQPVILPTELKNKLTLVSLKPVYAANKYNHELGRNTSTYIKVSTFPLTYEMIGNTEMDMVRRQAEYLESKYGQPVQIAMKSGVKEGANNVRNIWNINEEDKTLTANIDAISELKGEELDRDGFGIQLEEPLNETKTKINTVTQANKLLFAGLLTGFDTEDGSMGGFVYDGIEYTGLELKQKKEEIRKQLIKQAKDGLLKDLGLKQNIKSGKLSLDKNNTQRKFIKKLHSIILKEMKSRNYTELDKEMIKLINDNEFKFPLDFIPKSARLEALLLSIITNRIVKLKVPGKNYINAAGNGIMTFKRNDLYVSDIIYTNAYNNKNLKYVEFSEDGKSMTYAQCFLPFNFTDDNGKLLDVNQFVEERNGKKYLKVGKNGKFDENLLKLIGLRIPNQGHSSMLTLEIAGFLPSYMQNVIVLPLEITAQMGSDNDYDHLYTYSYNTNMSLAQEEYDDIKNEIKENYTFDNYEGDDDYKSMKSEYNDKVLKYNDKNIAKIKRDLNAKESALFDNLLKEEKIYTFEKQPTGIKDKNDYINTLKTKLSLFNKEWIKTRNENKKEISKLKTDLYNIRNKEYHNKLSKRLNEVKREHGTLDKLSYNSENIADNKTLELQNAYVDIFHSVLSNVEVAKQMIRTLDLPYLGKESDLLESVTKTKNAFDPLDPIYAIYSYINNQAGKTGVATQSLLSTFLALIEDKKLIFNEDLLKENPIWIKTVSGKKIQMIGSGKGHSKLTSGEELTNIVINMMFQNETVDNANRLKLMPINYNKMTAPIYNSLMTMVDKDSNSFPMESLTRLMGQEVMYKFIEKLENKSDITGFFSSKKPDEMFFEIYNEFKRKYERLQNKKEGSTIDISNELNKKPFVLESPNKLLSYIKMTEDEKNNSIEYLKYQSELARWLSDIYSNYIQPIDKMLMILSSIDSKSIGKSLIEMSDRRDRIRDSIDNSPFVNAQSILGIKTKTETGQVAEDSYELAYNLYLDNQILGKYIFSQNSDRFLNVKNTLKDDYNVNLEYTENKNKVWTLYRQYIYNEALKTTFNIDLQEERTRLLYGDNSLAVRTMNYQNEKWFKNNGFLIQLSVDLNQNTVDNKDGKFTINGDSATFVTFDSSRKDTNLDKMVANEFVTIYTNTQKKLNKDPNNKELQDKLEYLEDIIKYTILEGGVQNAHNYTKYIHPELLERLGILHHIREAQNIDDEINNSLIVRQILLNDIKLIPNISLNDSLEDIPDVVKYVKSTTNKNENKQIISEMIISLPGLAEGVLNKNEKILNYEILLENTNMFRIYDRDTKETYVFEYKEDNNDTGDKIYKRVNVLGTNKNLFNELGTGVVNTVFKEESNEAFKSDNKFISSSESIIPNNETKNTLNFNTFKNNPSLLSVFEIINNISNQDNQNGAVAKIISMFPELYKSMIVYNKVLSVRANVAYNNSRTKVTSMAIDLNRLDILYKDNLSKKENEFNELLLHELLHPIFNQFFQKVKNGTANKQEIEIYDRLENLRKYLLNEQIKKYPEEYKKWNDSKKDDELSSKKLVEMFEPFTTVSEMLSMGWTNSNTISYIKDIQYNEKTGLQLIAQILSDFIKNIADVFGIEYKENAYYNFIESSLEMYLNEAGVIDVEQVTLTPETKIEEKQPIKSNIQLSQEQIDDIQLNKPYRIVNDFYSIKLIYLDGEVYNLKGHNVTELQNEDIMDAMQEQYKLQKIEFDEKIQKEAETQSTTQQSNDDYIEPYYDKNTNETMYTEIYEEHGTFYKFEHDGHETVYKAWYSQGNMSNWKPMSNKKQQSKYLQFVTDHTKNDLNVETKVKQETSIDTQEKTNANSVTFNDGVVIDTENIKLNKGQEKALKIIGDFVKKGFIDGNKTISLKGYAGTGKTTILNILRDYLRTIKPYTEVFNSSPTNRANAVMKQKGAENVYTLHKLFGLRPDMELKDFNLDKLKFEKLSKNKLKSYSILLIDESSMINDDLYKFILDSSDDLNVQVIFIGDPEQFQPVGQNHKSKSFNDVDIQTELTEVMRTGENALLKESMNLREKEAKFSYKTNVNEKGEGIIFVDNQVEFLSKAGELYQSQEFKDNPLLIRMLAATNPRTDELNKIIRQGIWGKNVKNEYNVGEILMGYANWSMNYRSGEYQIYNGGDYIITSVESTIKTIAGIKYSGYYVNIKNLVNDITDNIFVISIKESREKMNKLAEHFEQIRQEALSYKTDKQYQKEAKKWAELNAFESSFVSPVAIKYKGDTKIKKVFKYGYAHTIHKSQGGTYKYTFLDGDSINSFPDIEVRRQAEYVGTTRSENITVVLSNKGDVSKIDLKQQVKPEQSNIDNAIDYKELGFSDNELKEGEDLINKCK